MATAYIVLPVPLEPELTDEEAAAYIQFRKALGYTQLVSDQRIELNEHTTLLRWADLGLVETQGDAEELQAMLQRKLPQHQWRIQEVDYPEAADIVFYGKHYRLRPRTT